jgi:hypothetical protein
VSWVNPVNPWSSYEQDDVVYWDASFPRVLDPGLLGPWQQVVVEAGEDTGVYRFDCVDRIDFDRQRDGFIGSFLVDNPDRPEATDVWLPSGFVLHLAARENWASFRTSSRLTFNNTAREAEDVWVSNMSVMARLAGLKRAYVSRPFSTTYMTVGDTDEDEPVTVQTYFEVSTDIWFPWTSGSSHDLPDSAEPLDNRVLAAYNAPRLNEFLRRVRETAVALGGTWSVQAEQYASQVDERGVILDAPRPTWHQHPRP